MDKKIILARIDQIMAERGITKYQLKENTDISSTIYQWRKNPKRDETKIPSLRSIEKICNFLGVSLSYFFAFDLEEQKRIQSTELTKEILTITPEQRKIIEDIVKQFCFLNETQNTIS